MACEQVPQLTALAVTAGQRGDALQFIGVLARWALPEPVAAGTEPPGHRGRQGVHVQGQPRSPTIPRIHACIPRRTDQYPHRKAKGFEGERPPAFEPGAYRLRHEPPSSSPPSTNGYMPDEILPTAWSMNIGRSNVLRVAVQLALLLRLADVELCD